MNRPAPKRGLGRGLGSLIPTAPVVNQGVRDADFAPGATNGDAAGPGSVPSANGAQIEDSALAPVDGAYFAELPVSSIRPNALNPRQVFDEDAMAELVHSITEVGLLQPVVVRRTGDDYELVMGERRW